LLKGCVGVVSGVVMTRIGSKGTDGFGDAVSKGETETRSPKTSRRRGFQSEMKIEMEMEKGVR
jgi:hypothetical protein